MKITARHHEIEVQICVRRSMGVDLPDVGEQTRTGLATLLGLAGLGTALAVLVALAISGEQGRAPEGNELLVLFVVGPLALGAPLWLWLLSGTRIGRGRGTTLHPHTLLLDGGGVRLDGRRCEVALEGARLVTGGGEVYELAEMPHELRELGELLSAVAEVRGGPAGQARDVPAALRSLLEASRRG